MSVTDPTSAETLAERAEWIRASYPELYTFLADWQRAMRRLLTGNPDPADPQLPAPADSVNDTIRRHRRGITGITTVLAGLATGGGQR